MQVRAIAAAAIIALVPEGVDAALVDFTVRGQVASVEYDFVNGVLTFGGGGPASTAFLAVAPIGTPYVLRFSIDTESVPVFSSPTSASFQNLAIGGGFSLAGREFALPVGGLFVGSSFGSQRYALFGNFPFGTPSSLDGFRPIDYAVELSGSTGAAIYPPLPTSVNPSDFPTRYTRLRFIRNQTGETGIRFSIDGITSTVAGVPEPETWILMLSGFGALGIAMRRRREVAPAR